MPKSLFTIVLFVITALLISACGAIATPRPPAPPTPEPVTLAPQIIQARESSQGEESGAAVSERPTEVPTATVTPLPPTATPTTVPPTATATPTSTPTEAPVEESVAAVGDPANGEALFMGGKDAAPPCSSCHFVDQDIALVGPSLVGIAGRAAERVAGMSAEEYLRESILDPNAFLVPDTDINVFSAGGASLMFQQYADYLSEEEVNDLVAYLMSLE